MRGARCAGGRKSRLDFWKPKLEGNRTRDLNAQRQLKEQGWSFLVIWECEIKDTQRLAKRIVKFLVGK
jgi:DNA mismatch endonuclease, patch repair protein